MKNSDPSSIPSFLILNSQFLILPIWQHPGELGGVHVGDRRGSAQPALPLPGLAREDVLLEGSAPQELVVLRPLEALGRAAVRFDLQLLWHLESVSACS